LNTKSSEPMQRKCPRLSTYYLLDDRCNDTVEGHLNQTESMDTAASSCSKVHEAYKISAKEFGCFGCKKTYTKMSSAKTHADANNGIKSFSCKTCVRGFTRKSDMKRHARDRHTGVSLFLCPQCQAPFARKEHVQKHQGQMHPEMVASANISFDSVPDKSLHVESSVISSGTDSASITAVSHADPSEDDPSEDWFDDLINWSA
jgi:uncharacterized Zn-finger protein